MSLSSSQRRKAWVSGYGCGKSEGFRDGVVIGCVCTVVFAMLAAAVLTLGGCGTVDDCEPMADVQAAYDLTAANWESEIGALPADYAYIQVETSEVAAFSERCPMATAPGGTLVGCTWYEPLRSTYVVEVLECRADSADTLGHEYAHVLLHLVTGSGDAGHERADVWGPVAAPREVE